MISPAVTNLTRRAAEMLLGPTRHNVQYFERRRFAIGIAAVAFPLYYYIWRDLFPQPYENLPLRLLGGALFLPLLFVERWPDWARRLRPYYWYFTLLYSLPFFFAFMTLKNGGTDVWVQSTLAAILVMILVLDWATLIVHFAVGTGLAWLAYFLTTDAAPAAADHFEHLPIILFVLVLGAASNYSREVVRAGQERAMLATAGSIAHELRTPLLGIKTGAAGLKGYLPILLEAYRLARENGLPVRPVRAAHLQTMAGVLDRIETEANYSNAIIDMLLANVRLNDTAGRERAPCSMARCVETALARYPFSARERALVAWQPGADFVFVGSELLMVHVLFNLLKNALRHIAKAGKGDIAIRIEPSPRGGRLVFRDTGSGIAPEVLPHIFNRFYTADDAGDSVLGTGIGLAFCRDVMHGFGGRIECLSTPGSHTELVLTFPPPSR